MNYAILRASLVSYDPFSEAGFDWWPLWFRIHRSADHRSSGLPPISDTTTLDRITKRSISLVSAVIFFVTGNDMVPFLRDLE